MKQLFDFLLAFRQSSSKEELSRNRLIISYIVYTAINNLLLSLVLFLVQVDGVITLTILVFGSIYLLVPLLFRTSFPNSLIFEVFLVFGFLAVAILSYLLGGIHSIAIPWFIIIILFAALINGQKSALIWLIISILTIIVFAILKLYHIEFILLLSENLRSIIYIVAYIGLFSLSLITAVLFDRARVKAKKELESKNISLIETQEELNQNIEELTATQEELFRKEKEINNSIKTALTIQEATLPHEDKLKSILQNYFIVFKPRDIVSGDFYWANQFESKKIVAIVDCTGHGVPGAFMSLIGKMILDNITKIQDIHDPSKILELLHHQVHTVLRQHETGNTDGMDVVLISIEELDDERTKIVYAGAKNKLMYYSSTENKILEIKGNRYGIGGNQKDKLSFDNHEITLKKGSIVYLSTDGFRDQNNPAREKFGSKRMEKLLLSTTTIEMPYLAEKIESELEDFMAKAKQRDDILLLGIKI